SPRLTVPAGGRQGEQLLGLFQPAVLQGGPHLSQCQPAAAEHEDGSWELLLIVHEAACGLAIQSLSRKRLSKRQFFTASVLSLGVRYSLASSTTFLFDSAFWLVTSLPVLNS